MAYVQLPAGSEIDSLQVGPASALQLYDEGINLNLFGWSPDGEFLLYAENGDGTWSDADLNYRIADRAGNVDAYFTGLGAFRAGYWLSANQYLLVAPEEGGLATVYIANVDGAIASLKLIQIDGSVIVDVNLP